MNKGKGLRGKRAGRKAEWDPRHWHSSTNLEAKRISQDSGAN